MNTRQIHIFFVFFDGQNNFKFENMKLSYIHLAAPKFICW